MPLLSKQVISNYLRSNCQRRLRLDLHPDITHLLPNGQTAQQERQPTGMPPRYVSRPELRALAAVGEEWGEAKINDLIQTFGLPALIGNSQRTPAGAYRFSGAPLAGLIAQAAQGRFIVQPQFDAGVAFQNAL